jgi:putative hemolysin
LLIVYLKNQHSKKNTSMYDISFKNFSKEIVYPTLLADSENFLIKIADTEEELKKTLIMRYKVFNIEQGKGLATADKTGIDIDEYDEYCLQMIVVDKLTREPVGTYRAHLGLIASNARGFYSSTEYNISGLDKIASASIEVGRSCVLPEYRNGAAVSMLWAGIGELLARSKLQYLFGCVSLEVNDPAVAWALYEHFKKEDMLSDIICGVPSEGYELKKPKKEEITKHLKDIRNTKKMYLPPLFKGYLRLGTKIAGEPIYDPEFGTIDFLILLDTYQMPRRYARHFIRQT